MRRSCAPSPVGLRSIAHHDALPVDGLHRGRDVEETVHAVFDALIAEIVVATNLEQLVEARVEITRLEDGEGQVAAMHRRGVPAHHREDLHHEAALIGVAPRVGELILDRIDQKLVGALHRRRNRLAVHHMAQHVLGENLRQDGQELEAEFLAQCFNFLVLGAEVVLVHVVMHAHRRLDAVFVDQGTQRMQVGVA